MFEHISYSILFYTLSIIMIISGLGVIFLPNLLHSCISLFAAFCSAGFLFILLDSDFLGLSQILIYSIGVCILFSIIIMISGQYSSKIQMRYFVWRFILAAVSVGTIFLTLLFSLTNGFSMFNRFSNVFNMQINILELGLQMPANFSIKMLALNLLTKYLFPFELISVIILVALVGVVVLCKRKIEGE